MFFLLVSLLAGISGQAASHSHSDHPSVHGMAVVGKERIYLSHLPMFHSPHDYQAIFAADFDKAAKEIYLKSKAESDETVYTIAPEPFVLPDMAESPRPFRAALYRGHFERGGEKIAIATITIKRVVYFKKFDPRQAKAESAKFFLFGEASEKFLFHEITAKPDFDQLLAAELANEEGSWFTVLSTGNEPVKSGWLTLQEKGEAAPIRVRIKTLYLEEGDLAH